MDPLTLAVLGVASWTVRAGTQQFVERATLKAGDKVEGSVAELLRSLRTSEAAGSPIEPARVTALAAASRFFAQRLAAEWDVSRLDRRLGQRPEARWCSDFRDLLASRSAIGAFVIHLDVSDAPDLLAASEALRPAFHQAFLDWLSIHDLRPGPRLLDERVLNGFDTRDGRTTLFDQYVGQFTRLQTEDDELNRALVNTALVALGQQVERIPDEVVARQQAERRAAIDSAIAGHCQATLRHNARVRLPLKADSRRVTVPIDAVPFNVPLSPPPGASGPRTATTSVGTSHAERLRARATARSSDGRGSLGQDAETSPPVFTLGECLDDHPLLVVSGGPGTGKSTLVSILATHYARAAESRRSDPTPSSSTTAFGLPDRQWLPVAIRLRDVKDAINGPVRLRTLIRAQLELNAGLDTYKVDELATELMRRLGRGEGLLLVDGIDELSPQRREQLIEDLITEVGQRPDLAVVVTSRLAGLSEVLPDLLQEFDHFRIAELRLDEQRQFLTALRSMAVDLGGTAADLDRFTEAFFDDPELRDLGHCVQLLALMVQLYLRFGRLPKKRKDLFRKAVVSLIQNREDGTVDVDRVWPEMTHLAFRMQQQLEPASCEWSAAIGWVAEYIERARARGLDTRPTKPVPLPASADEWLGWATSLAILNATGGGVDPDDQLDEVDEVEAGIEFVHLVFQEFCAAHALEADLGVLEDDDREFLP